MSNTNYSEDVQKRFLITSLGNAVELTLGDGDDTFENFGCKWKKQ